mmetsp:Transcript_16595/g.34248  ORF Transcript_16595/g.34248 Transcript_16595/m.34248 type:complete len:108 (-) Transcript_16595:167-490(-)
MARFTLIAVLVACLLALTSAFVPPTFVSSPHSSAHFASRVNAKKEKRLRNRDNMRQFKTKRGSSRRRLMKKIASNAARQSEMEFVAKLFQTQEAPAEPEIRDRPNRR